MADSSGHEQLPHDLIPLSELGELELARGQPDPRGWTLVSRQGEELGRVTGLLASPSRRRAYLAVLQRPSTERFLIPLAAVSFDEALQQVMSPYDERDLADAPRYEGLPADLQRHFDYWRSLYRP